ncbi:leukocyte immunoglobulin-like receptor subfamily A member 6 [Suncus etruscus]|uniref:leukocyte immunoglobulin-like receptor subfamily A member 6 n=1 Tax=Suncus etruscus TaxID=109475 RepID=UPI00210FB4C7|nr:leukocyte immunoglobulin-like receptor subfamily A member 6 [Suncus etruscus]
MGTITPGSHRGSHDFQLHTLLSETLSRNQPTDTPHVCPVGTESLQRMDRTEGDAMTSLLALLCLGLSVDIRILVNARTVPRPILWAEPSSVVLRDSPVTLWCQGNVGVQQFHLVKTGISPPWETYLTLQPGDKAKFSVLYITESHAGTYQCSYVSPAGWSESSDPLELVVTGLHSKPSLSAFLSPVVASGETVTLQCDSWLGFDTFVLTPEGDLETLRKLDTPQVWSLPSDPLQLLVSGTSRRPSLLSSKGQIVSPGQIPTLQCHSKVAYDTFAQYMEESHAVRQHPDHHSQAGFSQANFTLGPVSASDGGRYRCIGRTGFTSLWSEPSDPVDILVAGPPVNPGDNVTLMCRSSGRRNTFLLAKEGTADPVLRVKLDKTGEITKAEFSFHPVTSVRGESKARRGLARNREDLGLAGALEAEAQGLPEKLAQTVVDVATSKRPYCTSWSPKQTRPRVDVCLGAI